MWDRSRSFEQPLAVSDCRRCRYVGFKPCFCDWCERFEEVLYTDELKLLRFEMVRLALATAEDGYVFWRAVPLATFGLTKKSPQAPLSLDFLEPKATEAGIENGIEPSQDMGWLSLPIALPHP